MKKQAKKKEIRAFGRVVQSEGYHVEKTLFESREKKIRFVGTTSAFGVVRISVQVPINGTWTEVANVDYGDALLIEKTLATMRKLLLV